MDWKDIPSLTSLRAFEAAARCGSFSKAARELNVTHAAVAQHVRGLEDFFATELMFRRGRGMELTDAGTRLAQALGDGFNTIAGAVAELRDTMRTRALRMSCTPSFAENWLMPRIGGFWADHPEVELELVPTERLVDLRRDGFDVGIRYGRGSWPGLHAIPLAASGNVAVGTPELLGRPGILSRKDLMAHRWVIDRSHREAQVWARERKMDLERMKVTWFDTNTLTLSAVRAGLGLSLQPAALVQQDLETGRLLAVSRQEIDDLGYYLVTVAGREQGPQLRRLIRWLVRAAGVKTEALRGARPATGHWAARDDR